MLPPRSAGVADVWDPSQVYDHVNTEVEASQDRQEELGGWSRSYLCAPNLTNLMRKRYGISNGPLSNPRAKKELRLLSRPSWPRWASSSRNNTR